MNAKRFLGALLQVAGVGTGASGIIWEAIFPWMYPDLTSRRLWIDHWPAMLGGLGLFVLGAVLFVAGGFLDEK